VFLITIKASVWRSKDGGSTFEDISERFKSEGGARGREWEKGTSGQTAATTAAAAQ
jgi:hypothetical protein